MFAAADTLPKFPAGYTKAQVAADTERYVKNVMNQWDCADKPRRMCIRTYNQVNVKLGRCKRAGPRPGCGTS